VTTPDHSPWQRPSPSQTPRDSALNARPGQERKAFASSTQKEKVELSPWARPETGTNTEAPRAPQPRPAEIVRVAQKQVPVRQMSLGLTTVQKNAIGVAIFLSIVIPFFVYPIKGSIYQFSPVAFWLFKISLGSVLPLLAMWVLAKKFAISPQRYGLSFPPRMNWDLFGLSILVAATIAAAYLLAFKLAWVYLWQYVELPAITYSQALPTGIWHLPAVLAISFDAGFCESVIFIGLPWLLFRDSCRSTTGKVAFAVVTSVIFGACHRGNGFHEVIAVTFFGLAAVFWFLKVRDLWPVVIGHGLVDVGGYI